MTQLNALRQKTHSLNVEIYALYLSYRDERVSWYVRMLVAFAIGYAISPIDFIPDLVAVFGFLDDVLIVSLSFHFSYQLIAKDVVGQAKLQAFEELNGTGKRAVDAGRIVSFAWLLVVTLAALVLYKLLTISFV